MDKNINLYNKLPIIFQNLICNLYGFRENKYRFGNTFKNEYKFLLESDLFTKNKIIKLRNERIRTLINHAIKNSEFYKKIYNQKFKNSSKEMQLGDFPLLTKGIIRENFQSIKTSEEFQKNIRVMKTSGTTGSALSFIVNRDSLSSQWAVWWRHRARFGFYPGDWHVNFTGKPFVPYSQEKPPFWRVDFFRRQILICSSQLNKKKIKFILDYLNRKRIPFFTGYPSIISHFCSLLETENLTFDYKIKLVVVGAEKCHDFQLKNIKRVTGALVTDQYGFSEGCGNASKCVAGNYHVDWEFCHLECHKPIKNIDGTKTGEIIATGYKNLSFPFLRYMTGDIGTFAPKDFICPCGNKSPVLFEINGRNEDYILTSDGNKIMRFDYLFKNTKGIKEAQIIQNRIDEIDIYYVPNRFFTPRDIKEIEFTSKKFINPNLKLNFISVEEIERMTNGKFKAVVSNL